MLKRTIFTGDSIEAVIYSRKNSDSSMVSIYSRDNIVGSIKELEINFGLLNKRIVTSANFKNLLRLIDSLYLSTLINELKNCESYIHEKFAKSKAVNRFLEDDTFFTPAFRISVILKYWIIYSSNHNSSTIESNFETLIENLKKVWSKDNRLLKETSLNGLVFKRSTNFLATDSFKGKFYPNNGLELCTNTLDSIIEKLLFIEFLNLRDDELTYRDFLKNNDCTNFNYSAFTTYSFVIEKYDDFKNVNPDYLDMIAPRALYYSIKEYVLSQSITYTREEPKEWTNYFNKEHMNLIEKAVMFYLFDYETANFIFKSLYRTFRIRGKELKDFLQGFLIDETLEIIFSVKDSSLYFNEWCQTYLSVIAEASDKTYSLVTIPSDSNLDLQTIKSEIYSLTHILVTDENETPFEWLITIHLNDETNNLVENHLTEYKN